MPRPADEERSRRHVARPPRPTRPPARGHHLTSTLGRPAGARPSREPASRPAARAAGTARPRRRRLAALSLVVLVVFAAAYCAVQILRPPPAATASVVLTARTVRAVASAGDPPAVPLPLPAAGAADVAVEGYGQLGGTNQEAVLPLASVAKLMTALIVLKDHPLAPGEQGPLLSVSASDAATYAAEVAADDSVVKVEAGEQLSEFQALEALLVPSADNMADILATWDAGSVGAFVAKMNAEARALGLLATHYVDPAGLDPSSAGTAADMVRLASYVMAVPVLREIVAMPQVTLPVAGTVYNYDTVLGHDGIIGIKTGSTPEAGGNFVFAARRSLYGRTFTVLGAVLDQGGTQPLQSALDEAERLCAAAFSHITEVTILPAGAKVVAVDSPWGSKTVAVTSRSVQALGVAGETAAVKVQMAPSAARLHSVKAGEQLATVRVSFPGGTADVPALAVSGLQPAPLTWRLSRT